MHNYLRLERSGIQPRDIDEYEIGLVGDTEALGNWNVSHCLRLKPQHEHGRLALRHRCTSDLVPNLLRRLQRFCQLPRN